MQAGGKVSMRLAGQNVARIIFSSQVFIEIIRIVIVIRSLYLKKQDVVLRYQLSSANRIAIVQQLVGGHLLIRMY